MDYTKRIKFAGITFKPNYLGTVRWTTVQKILTSGKVECTSYYYGPNGSETTLESALEKIGQVGPDRCHLAESGTLMITPRYAGKRHIRVTFERHSFVTIYDLGDLAELADGTEVDEACQACVGDDCDELPALVTRGKLSLVVDNT